MNKNFLSVILGAIATLGLVLPSQAQTGPPAFGGTVNLFTNSVTASGGATNAGAKRVIDVPANTVAAFSVTLIGTGAATSNVVAGFNASLNGQDWTTDFPYSLTVASSGTATVRKIAVIGTNLNARFIALDRVTTDSTNAVTITNVTYTFFPR